MTSIKIRPWSSTVDSNSGTAPESLKEEERASERRTAAAAGA
jgi:hypothetical protein